MKTETHYIYWSFNEYAEDGINYAIFGAEYHNRRLENPDSSGDYKFVCEVELPPVDKGEVTAKGVAVIQRQQAKLQKEINGLEEKKQQLLAIEFKP